MNKQELIETLESLERDSFNGNYNEGYDQAVRDCLAVAKQLDEPKKVVVPQFVAEWIELYKKENKTTLWHVMNKIINEKFLNHQNIVIWFENDSNKHILEQAWVNGYEVEKDQLYYVDFINDGDVHKRLILDRENGKYNIVDWSDNLIGLVQEMFTEQEIKSIDERYWPFAVKVDGE
ncbi:DUF1642 domain-containing protein [Enterococcus faecalis]|nr:DUF1642 domain-containing protein [Enterococcus faecalis]